MDVRDGQTDRKKNRLGKAGRKGRTEGRKKQKGQQKR